MDNYWQILLVNNFENVYQSAEMIIMTVRENYTLDLSKVQSHSFRISYNSFWAKACVKQYVVKTLVGKNFYQH